MAMAWRADAASVKRFEQRFPVISELYSGVSIVVPPTTDRLLVNRLQNKPGLKLSVGNQGNENRRYRTIKQALTFEAATHIHYCDGDHVIARMEHNLADWKHVLERIGDTDCLIVMRSPAVFEQYPRPLRETERIINQVGSL
ncbi:MAG: hypothetical protein AAF125_22925, partial [Chloroflexota bacterium]